MNKPSKQEQKEILQNYSIFWTYYLGIQSNVISDKVFTFGKNHLFSISKIRNNKRSNSLVIHNSQRQVTIKRLTNCISNYKRIAGKAENSILLKDTYQASRFLPSELTFFLLKIVLSDLYRAIRYLLKNKRIEEVFFILIKEYFHKEDFKEIILFTENNRLTEIFRHAAIFSGLEVTTFLHGTTSDAFGAYYLELNKISEISKSKLNYINMAPGLPQPLACKQNLVKVNGKEIYFQNEKLWLEREESSIYDVMIIGGTYWSNDYENSKYFKNELSAIDDCLKKGYSVVYAPHPGVVNRIEKFLPKDIDIYPLWQKINSSKCVVGHYSTSLFTSHLIGKDVFIFDTAWSNIPQNLKEIFSSISDHTYTIENIIKNNLSRVKVSSKSFINIEDSEYS